MIDVTSELPVDRPAEQVFAFIADPENNPTWQKGMRSCRWTSKPPIGVGSTYEQHAGFLGKSIDSTFQVIAFEPGRSMTITTTESTFPITVTRSVEPTGEGSCIVRTHVQGDPSGVFRLAARPLTSGPTRSSGPWPMPRDGTSCPGRWAGTWGSRTSRTCTR